MLKVVEGASSILVIWHLAKLSLGTLEFSAPAMQQGAGARIRAVGKDQNNAGNAVLSRTPCSIHPNVQNRIDV